MNLEESFYEGRLPISFARFFDPLRGENGRDCTIRIQELTLTTTPLSEMELDPRQALSVPFTQINVWSNGLEYIQTDHGLRRKLRSEELLAKSANMRALVLPARTTLLCLVFAPWVYCRRIPAKHSSKMG